MVKIKSAKIQAIGNSYFVLVPMSFIKNEIVDVEQEYDVSLKVSKREVDEDVC